MFVSDIGIGDVICTRNPKGWPAFLIRMGACLQDRPNITNHVIVAHHIDKAGTFWGIEGRADGVGYINLKSALAAPYTISNYQQPKTEEQRFVIAKAAEGLIGTPYDWRGIAQDAMEAIGAQAWWDTKIDGKVPAQLVCSSLADWLYDYCGLPSPGGKFDRNVTPGDWAKFIIEEEWRA